MNAFALKEKGKTSRPGRTRHAPGMKIQSPQSPHGADSVPVVQAKCVCGGGCPRCRGGHHLQAKLRIGYPGDTYEREADRVADQVMRMPDPVIQRKPG